MAFFDFGSRGSSVCLCLLLFLCKSLSSRGLDV